MRCVSFKRKQFSRACGQIVYRKTYSDQKKKVNELFCRIWDLVGAFEKVIYLISHVVFLIMEKAHIYASTVFDFVFLFLFSQLLRAVYIHLKCPRLFFGFYSVLCGLISRFHRVR